MKSKCALCDNGIITHKNSFEPCPVCRKEEIKRAYDYRYGKSQYKLHCSKGSQEFKIRLDKKNICKTI